MIYFKIYFELLRRWLNNNHLINITHPKPFEIIFSDRDGRVIGLEAQNKVINFKYDNKLTYSENGKIENDLYDINSHSYHFQPNSTSTLHPFRIDKDRDGRPHANDYDSTHKKYNATWPDHLCFPENTSLNIEDFNLVLALQTSMFYIRSSLYPLDDAYSARYNEMNDRKRRQIT